MVKNPPAVQETWVQSLGWEDLLEEGMAIHSSILAWRVPMERGAWQDTVHGVTESDMTERLSIAHIVELNSTISQLDIIDIDRLIHPTTADFTFFSRSHETLIKIVRILGHKTQQI